MKIYYFVSDNGDGSTSVNFYKTRELAESALEYAESVGEFTSTDGPPEVLDTENDDHFDQALYLKRMLN